MVYNHFDLLTLHRPTKVDELFSNVQKPICSLPKRRLPNWELLRLEDKLPIIKAPEGAVIFTTGKLGQKLWAPQEKLDFDLSDPYCRKTCFAYNSLHDKHLRSFFAKPANREKLYKQGLITRDGDVICSLAQFNKYRRYLSKEYLDQVNAWRKFQDRLAEEKRLLQQAYTYIRKDIDRKIKNSRLEEKMRQSRQQRIMEEKQEEERWRVQRKQYYMKLKAIEAKRAEEALARKEKARKNDERILNRIAAAKKIEHHRKILVFRRWREADKIKQQRLIQEKKEQLSKKRSQEIHNWNMKANLQILARKRNEDILEIFHEDQLVNIMARIKKASEVEPRMEAERLMIKERKKMESHEKKKQKAIAEAITKATKGDVDPSTAEEVVALLKPSAGKDPIHILEGAKTVIDKLKIGPEPVNLAINMLLDNVVTTYTKKNVLELLNNVLDKAKQTLFKRSVKFSKASISTTKQRTSIKSTSRQQLSSSKMMFKKVNGLAQSVSFGSATTIGAILVPGELRSTKERPPTPVPSLTELAEVVFREPVSLTDVYEEEVNADQCNLEKIFTAVSAQLLKAVLRRTEKSMEKGQQLLYIPEKEFTIEGVGQKLTDAILHENIHNLAESEEMQLAIDVLVRELLKNFPVL